METTSQQPIRSIAAVARDKFDGNNMRFGTGGAVHAVELRTWRGELLPAPACHVGSFGDTGDARPWWGGVTCGRAGCREHRGRTGSQVAYVAQLAKLRIRLTTTTGVLRVTAAECLADPGRRAALAQIDHPVIQEALRRLAAEVEPLDQYAARIARQRRAAVAGQLGLFDVA